MNPDLQTLLQRWRDGSITPEEMRALTAMLTASENRRALRRDWFLDAALPQALAASAVIARTPKPSLTARLRRWFAGLVSVEARDAEPALGALQMWARVSFAALALSLITAGWLVRPQRHDVSGLSDAEQVAQIIFQKHFSNFR